MFDDSTAASHAFHQSAQRLLHPQQWKDLSGTGSASFEVIDQQLNLTDREIAEGDYIRIDIPGPGPRSGNGYDWVKVELIESSGDHLGIKVKPCANPEEKQEEPAHFFSEASSSTLMVRLTDITLTASYHGRNETVNNETGNVAENIRNTAIATGALAGLSEVQWTKLIRGLLNGEP
ncbi:MAG: hypothetical protein DI535_25085 [Citrobacter freundii]|nr:MAG: hypothetical protein DI535_25085 [Citrobacter freundii]